MGGKDMITFITSDKRLGKKFVSKCEKRGVEYKLVTNMTTLFVCIKEIDESIVMIDYFNFTGKEMVKEFINLGHRLQDAFILDNKDENKKRCSYRYKVKLWKNLFSALLILEEVKMEHCKKLEQKDTEINNSGDLL